VNILLDACVPAPVRRFLANHFTATAQEMGWGTLKNGELLRAAEGHFQVLVTADQNLRYQQNLTGRTLAIVVLPTNDWTVLREMAATIEPAVSNIRPGEFVEILQR
jgi:predicted nuclease of predicted toxin-antitoxin system